jgi:hypothetical protein
MRGGSGRIESASNSPCEEVLSLREFAPSLWDLTATSKIARHWETCRDVRPAVPAGKSRIALLSSEASAQRPFR